MAGPQFALPTVPAAQMSSAAEKDFLRIQATAMIVTAWCTNAKNPSTADVENLTKKVLGALDTKRTRVKAGGKGRPAAQRQAEFWRSWAGDGRAS